MFVVCCCNTEAENAPIAPRTTDLLPLLSADVGPVVLEKIQESLSAKKEAFSYSVELKDTDEKHRPDINVQHRFGRVIITGVVGSGLISHWNNTYADLKQEVHVGDEIMSVNGELDRMCFLKELNTNGTVNIELQKPTQYTLRLNKERSNLGMTVSGQFVTKIPEGGFFHKWLLDNPTVTIGLGDFVLDVNGYEKWQQIRIELVNATSLTMTIAHYETDGICLGEKATKIASTLGFTDSHVLLALEESYSKEL